MTADLDEIGYEQMKRKLASMELRLNALEERTDLHPAHWSAARRSYLEMMRQYARENKFMKRNTCMGVIHRRPLHELMRY
jgi:hypothetical protein